MACRRGVTAHMAKSTAQDLAGARGHFVTAGTPAPIADLVEDWFADGCNVMPPILPAQFDVFADEVVPILQRRGLFRTEYTGSMLRDHYGLAVACQCIRRPSLDQ
jgi:alkanesulfonate monooxygenase SsuD/methylene tetrahydromethanopterin reductase-like flavin-dependent oxidoreductase (luciferase family)